MGSCHVTFHVCFHLCILVIHNKPDKKENLPNTDSKVLHALFIKFGSIISSKVKTTPSDQTLLINVIKKE